MRIGRVSAGSGFIESIFITLMVTPVGLVGSGSSMRRKADAQWVPAFTTPDNASCLRRRTGAKLAAHNQGRDRHVAGDRWRRFYRIERRGRVERRGPDRRGGLRPARP